MRKTVSMRKLLALNMTHTGELGPPEGIPTLMQWWGLCGHMIPRVMLVVAYATGRASHARQVKGDDPDEKGYPGPRGWRLGVRLTTSPHKNKCYETPPPPKRGGGGQGPPRAVELMIMTVIR